MTFLEKVQQAKSVIQEALQRYPNITLACSFGKDSMVTLHLTLSIKPDIPVFSVVSNTEFPETYTYIKDMVKKYHLNYTEYDFKQVGTGAECCGTPKVEATKKALEKFDAWISGVRADEGETRTNFKLMETAGRVTKVNPILYFSELDVWRYLAINQIPVNPKYGQGYRSLGCALCSTPEKDAGEKERAGRWRGTSKAGGECGIHLMKM